ncbi:hypothetical protein TIFTF001_013472 [Ficus carica]|uniref:WAT1-related protein n=1 Tax=Ficus carica TaxID=3494 RepID=A0AA88A4G0_FICCA|nr:hypothetical protein TIFTF001_013472 [Ficus carica]
MMVVQVFATGMQILTRVILVEGTFIFSLMAYRHVVASLCVAPLAFYFERGHEKKFGWQVWFWLFVNALTGITFAMGMFYYGLRDTTATYATNFLNLIPIVTFVFSIITGMEKLKQNTRAGQVKTLGALLCVAGALTSSLYKGKEFHIGHHHVNSHIAVKVETPDSHWARGTFLLVGSCLSYSSWFIVQGALATAATFCLLLWAISKRGPTFPSMFNPLTLIFVALSEALILGEAIRVGILIGMVFIILGLYSFLWGQRKEIRSFVHDEQNVELADEEQGKTNMPSSSPTRDNILY